MNIVSPTHPHIQLGKKYKSRRGARGNMNLKFYIHPWSDMQCVKRINILFCINKKAPASSNGDIYCDGRKFLQIHHVETYELCEKSKKQKKDSEEHRKIACHSVLEQIQEIWHDTVSRLVWLQSRGKTLTENQKKIFCRDLIEKIKVLFFKNPQDLIFICFRDNLYLVNR